MRRPPPIVFLLGFLLILISHSAFPSQQPAKHGPSLRILLASRLRTPRLAGSSLSEASARERCNVTIRFTRELSPSDITSLEGLGVRFERIEGNASRVGTTYGAYVPWGEIDAVSARSDVEMIESVWHPRMLPALDLSAVEIQADRVWEEVDGLGDFLTGKGVVVADFDTGIDVSHPHFWNADGDTLQWLDVNVNGVFDPGTDGVDLNADGLFEGNELLDFFDGEIYDPARTFGGDGVSNKDGKFQPGWDWLYNDSNGNGARDLGRAFGFDESSPAYGERLFILVDADSDGSVDPGEKLVSLSSSKILATFNAGGVERTRGADLIDTQADQNGHGTSVCGILVGGVRGTSKFCGIAPDAQIIVGDIYSCSLPSLLTWARVRGARIVLYEVASFVGEPLDGSSEWERMLDAASDSMLQVTPSGNLCRGHKHSRMDLGPLDSHNLTSYVPASNGITTVYETILWRTPSNNVSFSLTTPDGVSSLLLGNGTYQVINGYEVFSDRITSPRGTAQFNILIYRAAGVGGDWSLGITSLSPAAEEVNGYIADDVTAWAGGAEFTNFRSNDRTICSPATADSAFTLASYGTRGYASYTGPGGGVSPGQLSEFSSRGKRIDDASIMEISAPGNYDVYTASSHDSEGAAFGGYRQFSGTSAAGPHVAAAAAIVLQAFPGFTPAEVKHRIEASAGRDTFTGPIYSDSWGHGKLRILDAVAPAIFVALEGKSTPRPVSALRQNFPNPFNPATSIRYVLPSNIGREKFAIRVFDSGGRMIKTIVQGEWGPGAFIGTAGWAGTDERDKPVSSGVYFIRLDAKGISSSVKAVLLR